MWVCFVHTHLCIQYISVYLWMVITSAFPWDVNSGYFQLLHDNLFRFLDLVALVVVEIFIEMNRRFSASLESLVWIWETWNTSWSSTWRESEVGEGLHSNKTQGRHLQRRADMASSVVTAVKGEGEEIQRRPAKEKMHCCGQWRLKLKWQRKEQKETEERVTQDSTNSLSGCHFRQLWLSLQCWLRKLTF